MTAASPGASTVLRMGETIGEILPEAARRFGDKTALVVEGETFSFAELEAMSNRVATGLVSIGVHPGDRVTLYGPNCWQWLVAYYAIAKTGAVVNPISSMLTTEEVRYVVADSGAHTVIASSDKGVPLLDLDGTDTLSDCGAVGRRRAGRCHILCDVARRGGLAVHARAARASRSGGDLLHVRDDGPSEGGDAKPSGGHLRRGRDGADGGAWS